MPPQAAAGGGAGSLGGSNTGGWGGGGGGDGWSGGQGDDSNADQPNKGGFYWKGWADRVAADPEFPFKVLLEQVRPAGCVQQQQVHCAVNFPLLFALQSAAQLTPSEGQGTASISQHARMLLQHSMSEQRCPVVALAPTLLPDCHRICSGTCRSLAWVLQSLATCHQDPTGA